MAVLQVVVKVGLGEEALVQVEVQEGIRPW